MDCDGGSGPEDAAGEDRAAGFGPGFPPIEIASGDMVEGTGMIVPVQKDEGRNPGREAEGGKDAGGGRHSSGGTPLPREE